MKGIRVTLSEETLADIGYIRLYLREAQKYPTNYHNVQMALDLTEKLIRTLDIRKSEEHEQAESSRGTS